MLRLKNITKDYPVADSQIKVLKGLSLSFRKNEFVAILGPSGCGKTTTLNIIGGLDKYTAGELFIAGKSTKKFSDHDWDIYRNQRIGFIFQSYNLIPHQTVLGNVELALTISGVSKEERIKKAVNALDKVGLAGEYDKKPNQLSGGQCQRVAIARALVNEPDILLADEPTGALDTVTSLQIMDLIREISKEKLVIMVTHNPEIAENYANRIVRLIDGQITEDSNPFSEDEEIKESELLPPEEKEKTSKSRMSWWTAFKLSGRNLLSKKGRTALTCIAGSIGIIGISMVLSVSNGVRVYISDMESDMLSGNPITISKTGYDITQMMNAMSNQDKIDFIKKEGYVNVDSFLKYLIERFGSIDQAAINNNITQEYVDYVLSMPEEYSSAVTLDYGLDMENSVYTDFTVDKTQQNMSLTSIKNTYTSLLKKTDTFATYASLITGLDKIIDQAPNNSDYILSQYDLKTGKIATEKNEIMIVIDKNSALSDIALAQLGYFSQEEFLNIAFKATSDPHYDSSLDKDEFTYSELLGKGFTWYPNDQIFNDNTLDPLTGERNPFTYNARSAGLEDGLELKVVGILEPKESLSYGCLDSGFYYTEALTEYAVEKNMESVIVKYMNDHDLSEFNSTKVTTNGINIHYGIIFKYTYNYLGVEYSDTGFVGSTNSMSGLLSGVIGGMLPGGGGGCGTTTGDIYQLSLNNVGGSNIAETIAIYPADFEIKDKLLTYLDAWNGDGDVTVNDKVIPADQRDEIKYTDNLSLVIFMINSMVDIITVALIAFTALSLVVSCVMIAIITYVSVVERVKEIGVIRSLGGRKHDVSNLFNAETIVIGLISGLFGITVTYAISAIINLVTNFALGIGTIAIFPPLYALIMVLLSIVLTTLSGLIPASKASRQDPVVALRTE